MTLNEKIEMVSEYLKKATDLGLESEIDSLVGAVEKRIKHCEKDKKVPCEWSVNKSLTFLISEFLNKSSPMPLYLDAYSIDHVRDVLYELGYDFHVTHTCVDYPSEVTDLYISDDVYDTYIDDETGQEIPLYKFVGIEFNGSEKIKLADWGIEEEDAWTDEDW